jgi:hypothetical protein
MRRYIEAKVRLKAGQTRVLDVYALAEEIQADFAEANVALEDIAAMITDLGAQSGCALELDEREESSAQSA